MVGLQPSTLACIVGRCGALSEAPHLEPLFECHRGAEMGRPGAGILVLAPHTCLSVPATPAFLVTFPHLPCHTCPAFPGKGRRRCRTVRWWRDPLCPLDGRRRALWSPYSYFSSPRPCRDAVRASAGSAVETNHHTWLLRAPHPGCIHPPPDPVPYASAND